MTAKEHHVGTYRLGVDNVRVYLVAGDRSGAEFRYGPKDGGCAKLTIFVGLNGGWRDCVSGLLHEAMEAQLHRSGAGYCRTHSPRETDGCYRFMFGHVEFDRCCDETASFMADCLPDLSREWRRLRKRAKG